MLLSDARWIGPHGIGRFAKGVLDRLPGHRRITTGPKPLSLLNPFWLSLEVSRLRPQVFFSPGFNPPARCAAPFIFTLHDLIHLRVKEEGNALKRLYFEQFLLPAARRAFCILTVSEYSREDILQWTGLAEDRVIVVGNGVDSSFTPDGPCMQLGERYLLYIGNRKPHKNLDRLFQAFNGIADPDVKLVLGGTTNPTIRDRVARAGIAHRVVFAGTISDAALPALYRGATALLLPSLIEGFGLPLIEAMACGTPVVAARTSSIPEVVGGAAILIDPLDVTDMRLAMDRVLSNVELRTSLRKRGLERVRDFGWESVANRVRAVVETAGVTEWGALRGSHQYSAARS